MNQKNFTQKSQEAIQSAQTLSLEYGNPQIEQAHLLYTLLDQESGLIPQLVTSIGPRSGQSQGRRQGGDSTPAQGQRLWPGPGQGVCLP